ncbi:MAG TPA: glutamate--tRNA ligase, partial [Rhizobiales bacterium]|nr:glutamate--tRNA ligase [Hyphomicrobiales bacterium]
ARDLEWLGLCPDAVEYQSKRLDAYDRAAEKLKSDGRLYPCYETADELERRRRVQLAAGKPPVYDRAGLKLDDKERARLEGEGRKPHWRFRLDHRDVVFDDLIRGHQTFDMASLSDPVLIREDGSYLYTLPSVVDDIDMNISHVIRGEDHVTNTAVQIEIFKALGAEPPQFAHHSLLTGADGKGLSKRLGSLSIDTLRNDGLEAMAIVSHASLIGTSEAIVPCQSLEEVTGLFDLSKMSRAPARFDVEELKALNARLLHEMAYETARDRLRELGIEASEDFWLVVRGNIAVMSDAKLWSDVVYGDIEPVVGDEDRDFIALAKELLPDGVWDAGTWKAWTGALEQASGRKGRALFMPLRLALTGQSHGPELASLLPLVGREKTISRLSEN